MYTCVQYTVYRSIAELFKSDEDVKISTETEDVVGTEEVIIFQIKNPAKRRYVTSVSLFSKILVTKYRVEVGWAVTKYQVGSMCGVL